MNHTNDFATPESTSTNHLPATQRGRSYIKYPAYFQSQKLGRHAQDRHERLVAECETGFVTGCEASIKEAKSAAGSISKNPIQPKISLPSSELPLAPMSPFSSREQTHDYFRISFPPFGFLVVSIPVVVVGTVIRAVVRSGAK